MLSNSRPNIEEDTIARMTAWRHDFHAHPETGFEEVRTSGIVADVLAGLGIEVHRGLAKTGVVGTLRNGDGPVIGLRADMDALDMTEISDKPYRSTVAGKMHGCGHDGHTSMLLGAAEYLSRTRNFSGTVHFIFQPAEENLGGGREMVKDGLFDQFLCDAIYALHNFPNLPKGTFAVKYGAAASALDTFEIIITGKGTHAAHPERGIDTVLIQAQLVTAFQGIISRNIGATDIGVVTVTQVHGGDTWNVIPETMILRGTVRTFDAAIQNHIEARMNTICASLATMHGANIALDFRRGYPAMVNTDAETDRAHAAAEVIVGKDQVQLLDHPIMGSEDFAFMLQVRPGAYLFLGSGETENDPPVHNPRYDFNDDVLPTGAAWFAQVVEQELPRR